MKKNIKTLELGTINIESGKVYATDPCYSTDTWCQKLVNVKAGKYICRAVISDEGDWGKRISELSISHIDNPKNLGKYILSNNIGVDSGQCGFFEKEYYEEFHNGHFIDENDKDKEWYDKVCNITLNGDMCGCVEDKGVVSESGYGDGCYTLYAGYNSKDEIVALRVRFI